MRRVIKDRHGTVVGTAGDAFVLGTVGTVLVSDRVGRYDERGTQEQQGTVYVLLPLEDARTILDRRVAIYAIDEE
jgi:hypothetical protein